MATKDDSWQEVSLASTEMWDRENPIEGKLVEVKSNVGANGSMLYVIETKDGKVSLWGSTVLDNKFDSIKRGSMVRIEPQGLVKSKTGNREYHDYKVFFKEPEFEEVTLPEMPSSFLEG